MLWPWQERCGSGEQLGTPYLFHGQPLPLGLLSLIASRRSSRSQCTGCCEWEQSSISVCTLHLCLPHCHGSACDEAAAGRLHPNHHLPAYHQPLYDAPSPQPFPCSPHPPIPPCLDYRGYDIIAAAGAADVPLFVAAADRASRQTPATAAAVGSLTFVPVTVTESEMQGLLTVTLDPCKGLVTNATAMQVWPQTRCSPSLHSPHQHHPLLAMVSSSSSRGRAGGANSCRFVSCVRLCPLQASALTAMLTLCNACLCCRLWDALLYTDWCTGSLSCPSAAAAAVVVVPPSPRPLFTPTSPLSLPPTHPQPPDAT
jgi:hypothetical protein